MLALLTVSGRGQVWVVDAVMFCYGLSYGILGPAQSALLTSMVPADLLPDANGALRTAQESLRLIGPLAGAGLFVAVGARVIAVIDAASFASRSFLSCCCAYGNPPRTPPPAAGPSICPPGRGISGAPSNCGT